MKLDFLRIFLIVFLLITSCSPSPEAFATQTAEAWTTTPELTITPTITLAPTPTPIHKKGFAVKHESNDRTRFPWFSYLPNSIDENEKVYILLDAAGGQGSCDVKEATYSVEGQTRYYASYAEEWKYVLLFPAIPRDCSRGDNWNYFFGDFDVWGTHLDSSIFTGNPEDHNYRFDQKIMEMIEELRNQLLEDGYKIQEKVFLMGFSTGGNFANRFSLLHPEIVKAVGVGGLSGIISLPITSHEGKTYDWYNGISNFKELTGNEFDNDEFKRIDHLIFWGEMDDTNHCPSTNVLCFNSNPVKSNRIACDYFSELGYKVDCQEYENIGHEFTEEMHQDMFTFFEQHR